MGDNSDNGTGTAVFLHRLRNAETISSDIALRLAHMLFKRAYLPAMASQNKTLKMINPGGAKVALRDFQRLSIRATRIKRQSPISIAMPVSYSGPR